MFDRTRMNLVRQTKEKKIIRWVKNHPSSSLMFHHRLPTSTDNVYNACHPFSTRDFFDTQYVLIHNGIISNDDELKKEHEKLGIEYYSQQTDGRFNDSEALLWDVALYLEGKQTELKARGSIAFICMAIPKDGRKHTKLYFARNTGSPLHMNYTDKQLFLSSEGKGENIPTDKLYTYDYRTQKMVSSEVEVPSYLYRTVCAPYRDYDDLEDEWQGWYHQKNDSLKEARKALEERNKYYLFPVRDYTYTDVMFGKPTDDTAIMVNGDEIAVLAAVQKSVLHYLQEANGYYAAAFDMALDDLELYEAWVTEEQVYEDDILYEIDLLTAVLHALTTSMGWDSDTARNWRWIKEDTDGQKKLPLGA